MASPIEIIPGSDPRSLAQLQALYPHNPPNSATTCAWVQVKSLYVSVVPTSLASWPGLLANKGASQRVVIYTGRHGGTIGSKTAADVLYDSYKEKRFIEEDVRTVIGTLAASPGTLFSVRDAGSAPFNDILTLRQSLANDIQAGHLVVLAWCFSLLSMFEMPAGIPHTVQRSYAERYRQMSIDALVRDGYHWA